MITIEQKQTAYRAMAQYLIKRIEQSSKTNSEKFKTKYGRQKRIPITITEDSIYDRLIQIDGRCEITNIPFPLFFCKSHYLTPKKYFKEINRLLIPSIDRINSDDGYFSENYQIVIRKENIGKSNCTNEEALDAYEKTKTPPQEHTIYIRKQCEKNNQNLKKSVMKNENQELLMWLLNQEEYDIATKYFSSMRSEISNVKMENNKTKTKTNNNIDSKSATNLKRKWFEDNVIFIEKAESNHFSISLEFLNTTGHKDASKIFASAKATKMMKNNIPVFAVKSGRGYEYFINESDREVVGI